MRSASAFASVLCVVCLASAPAIAQDLGGVAPPTPAPPAASELPAVEVIQKQAQPAPKAAQKKSTPKKKQVVAPAPQPAPVAPVQPVEAFVSGTGGIDSGTVNMSPVAGSEIPIGKFPGARRPRLARQTSPKFHDASMPEVLQNTVPGVILGDAQGNIYPAEPPISRLRSLARQRRCPGPRRLPERRAHQRSLRRHRQLGFPARQRHRRHHRSRRQSGLRPQCARRRHRHRDA